MPKNIPQQQPISVSVSTSDTVELKHDDKPVGMIQAAAQSTQQVQQQGVQPNQPKLQKSPIKRAEPAQKKEKNDDFSLDDNNVRPEPKKEIPKKWELKANSSNIGKKTTFAELAKSAGTYLYFF